MNYIGRKDGGTYISGGSQNPLAGVDTDLLVPIGYDKQIADMAAKGQIKYRDAFIAGVKESKREGAGQEYLNYIKDGKSKASQQSDSEHS